MNQKENLQRILIMNPSFKEVSWQIEEPEYREDSALSYSTLAKYERNGRFSALSTLFDKDSSTSLTFGSMVDTLLTDGEEEFARKFLVIEDPGISETLKDIAQALYNTYGQIYPFVQIPDEILSETGKSFGFYAGDNYYNARVKNIKEKCGPYYQMLKAAEGKTIVTAQDVEDARKCADALRTNPKTAFFFAPNDPFDDSVERFYQLKFKARHGDIYYRGMADLIVVDHTNKTIQPCDLKTSSHNEWEFPKSFQQWLYQIQARLYYRLIKASMERSTFYKDYKLLPFKFIVVNRKNCKPMVWDFPLTETVGTINITTPTGYKITWRDPYTIGEELYEYLKDTPEYPNTTTDITEWLKTN